MTRRIESLTTPPKIDPETMIYPGHTREERVLLRGLHAGLAHLEASYVDDDEYESLLILWSEVTGTRFRDTLPTMAIDGVPVTGATTRVSSTLMPYDRPR